jgi:hypothetical protein
MSFWCHGWSPKCGMTSIRGSKTIIGLWRRRVSLDQTFLTFWAQSELGTQSMDLATHNMWQMMILPVAIARWWWRWRHPKPVSSAFMLLKGPSQLVVWSQDEPIPPELSGRLSLMFQLKCIGCKEIISMLTMSLIPQCHLLIKWVIKCMLLC